MKKPERIKDKWIAGEYRTTLSEREIGYNRACDKWERFLPDWKEIAGIIAQELEKPADDKCQERIAKAIAKRIGREKSYTLSVAPSYLSMGNKKRKGRWVMRKELIEILGLHKDATDYEVVLEVKKIVNDLRGKTGFIFGGIKEKLIRSGFMKWNEQRQYWECRLRDKDVRRLIGKE